MLSTTQIRKRHFRSEIGSRRLARARWSSFRTAVVAFASFLLGLTLFQGIAEALPEPSVQIDDVATSRWDGPLANAHLGNYGGQSNWNSGPKSIGDVNGDGFPDVAAKTQISGADGGAVVLFDRPNGVGHQATSNLPPTAGYRIKGNGIVADVSPVGDQNGDGTPDLLITGGIFVSPVAPRYAAFVVYGVSDPSTLPLCGSTATRCIDLTTLTADQGYKMDSPPAVRLIGGNGYGSSAGDFDGDGIQDFVFGSQVSNPSQTFGDRTYIVKGGVTRSGTIDLSTLPDSEVLRINGAGAGPSFGTNVGPVGDLNGDGKDDIYSEDANSGVVYVYLGRSFGESAITINDFDESDGLKAYFPPIASSGLRVVGDISGDGIPDMVAGTLPTTGLDASALATSVIFTPELPSSDPVVTGTDIEPGFGYAFTVGGLDDGLGQSGAPAGDLNNDGIPDVVTGASTTGGGRGVAYVTFGIPDPEQVEVPLGDDLDAAVGVAITGNEGDAVGQGIQPAGDTDQDGLPDYLISAPGTNYAANGAGSVYIVPGKSLINQVKTQSAVAVGNDSAVLNAGLSTNNRDSEVWFEYGTSDEYGQSTDPEQFEGSNSADAASAAIDGLTKNTTYHYRAVAKNALGLVRYGDDQTFTTTNVTEPDGPSPCIADPSLPGCDGYCQANPTATGCPDYDWCAANPGKCSTGGNSKARLALISTTKKIVVKRGKKTTLSVAVVNTGGKAAGGVKVCVKAPKRLVKVKKCVKVGKLGSGKTRVVKVKVKTKRTKGKATLKLTASGNKLSAKKAKVKVVVR